MNERVYTTAAKEDWEHNESFNYGENQHSTFLKPKNGARPLDTANETDSYTCTSGASCRRRFTVTKKRPFYACSVCLLSISILAIIIIAIGFYITRNFFYKTHYAVIIDAGSSSSKLTIYKWDDFAIRQQGYVKQAHEEAVKSSPGISSFVKEPELAFTSFEPNLSALVDQVIPPAQRSKSTIYLAATAGMRIAEEMNHNDSKRLYEQLAVDIEQKSRLKLLSKEKYVKTLTGIEEGLYGWITSNYLAGFFGLQPETYPAAPLETFGALDMGGASTQITFALTDTVADQLPPDQVVTKTLYGQTYRLFSRSLLCNGKNEMWDYLTRSFLLDTLRPYASNDTKWPAELEVDHPCLMEGSTMASSYDDGIDVCDRYFGNHLKELPDPLPSKVVLRGTSNLPLCRSRIAELMRLRGLTPCDERWCYLEGVRQPKARGKFYAFAGFSHFARFNGGAGSEPVAFNRSEFRRLTESVCRSSSTGSRNMEIFQLKFCFDGIYFDVLFHLYGIDTEEKWLDVTFLDKLNDSQLSWALGYAIDVSGLIPNDMPKPYVPLKVFAPLLLLFILLTLLSVLLFVALKKLTASTSKTSSSDNAPSDVVERLAPIQQQQHPV